MYSEPDEYKNRCRIIGRLDSREELGIVVVEAQP